MSSSDHSGLYEALFESIRRQEFDCLIIGGSSPGLPGRAGDLPHVAHWLDYFPRAHCHVLDQEQPADAKESRYHFIPCDLANAADLERVIRTLPRPRVLLDRSHDSQGRQNLLMRLFPLLQPGGFYALEDLRSDPGGSTKGARSMLKTMEEFLDTAVLNLDGVPPEHCRRLQLQIAHSFVHRGTHASSAYGPRLVVLQKHREATIEQLPAAEGSAGTLPAIDREWLTGRLFSFRSSKNSKVLSSTLRFEPNGRISGYRHANESAWKLENGKLHVLREDGVSGCITSPQLNADGTVSFVGRFLLAKDGIVHLFAENPVEAGPPMVFSFDLFDTLVARRCYEPSAIFEAVARKAGIPEFAELRRQEERVLWEAGDYTHGDIYAALGAATGWPAATVDRLRMLELAEEWDNLYPIEETVARVRPGDLIVTDMYLPLKFLRRVVAEKLGLERCVIHVSTHGKHRGEIWPKLNKTHRIARHYGDNWHSDIESARRAGIHAEHISTARWTDSETILRQLGMDGIASVIREARLRTFEFDVSVRNLQLAQFEINLPLLLIVGIHLLKEAREQRIDTLLMCSRDCNLWLHLLRLLASRTEAAPRVRYLRASRILLLSNSPEYAAYFSFMQGRRNFLIDVSGTGRSPAYFLGGFTDHAYTRAFLLAGSDEVAAHFHAADDIEV